MKINVASFRFWFTIISIFIIIQNVMGFDDKNLLLYLSTPPLFILNEWFHFMWDFGQFTMFSFYVCNLLTWFLAGLLLDLLLKRIVAAIKKDKNTE